MKKIRKEFENILTLKAKENWQLDEAIISDMNRHKWRLISLAIPALLILFCC